MKNILLINDDGELKMASSVDEGSNSLYINDDLISTTDWVGTGDYTFTIGGVTFTIAKAPSLNGNYQLIADGNNEFHFERALTKREEHLNQVYPVGSYYETSDTTFNPNASWVGTWENVKKSIFKASGSQTVNPSTTHELCEVTLPANSRYMVFGNVTTSVGTTLQAVATFSIDSTESCDTVLGTARVTTSAGQGCNAYLYVETGNAPATVNLLCYGYDGSSHTEYGNIVAVPLDHCSKGNVWHRIA